jgi:TetR/AcrR family transcriptional repressor of nem operon
VPRPREYERANVVEAAKNSFWARGYGGASIVDLELSTGLNRSSLYLAFGAKRGLFDAALDDYVESFIGPRVGAMEGASPGLPEVVGFFSGIKAYLLEDPDLSWRGCLMVNTIAELAGRDPEATLRGIAFRDQLRRAFTLALEGASVDGDGAQAAIRQRALMLTAATFGVWLTARLDPLDAAELCDAITAEVNSWGAPERSVAGPVPPSASPPA